MTIIRCSLRNTTIVVQLTQRVYWT